MVDRYFNRISALILEGSIRPRVKVKGWDAQKWVRSCINRERGVEFIDVWEALELRFANEGLEMVIFYEHDGVGIESWIEIGVKAIEA